jgi:hypothetical protein
MLNPEASLQSILNPELSQTITTLARQDGQTMLEWVEKILREAIQVRRQTTDNSTFSRRLKTLERLQQQQDTYLAEVGSQRPTVDTVAILDQLREERDAELLANCHTPSRH